MGERPPLSDQISKARWLQTRYLGHAGRACPGSDALAVVWVDKPNETAYRSCRPRPPSFMALVGKEDYGA